MYDLVILFSIVIMGVVFMALHISLFRLKKPNEMMEAMKLMGVSFILSSGIGCLVLVYTTNGKSLYITLFHIIFYCLLSTLLFLSYIMGVFILLDSSLRFKYLLTIASYGNQGITKKKFHSILSMKTLISHRVNRLIHAGILIKNQKGSIWIKNPKSIIVVREKLIEKTMKIYT